MAATAESVLKPDHQTARKHFIFTDEHEQLRESITNFAVALLASIAICTSSAELRCGGCDPRSAAVSG